MSPELESIENELDAIRKKLDDIRAGRIVFNSSKWIESIPERQRLAFLSEAEVDAKYADMPAMKEQWRREMKAGEDVRAGRITMDQYREIRGIPPMPSGDDVIANSQE